ncbi:MAG: 5'/3'-nucleotidase SurE [Bacilli bacterium]|nr:5'/3'-nucleotidase SurE [Bacilli bacterium]
MRILLTNDDGFDSVGIRLLKSKLEKYGQVVILAPDSPMSAKSVSLTLGKTVSVKEHEKGIFSCSGTPADCVSFGLSMFDQKFDLVVSGCNNGLNISYDTMYSGTIGAALQALMMGVPSIAVSTPREHFYIVESHFEEVFDLIMKKKWISKDYLLNINFPEGDEVKGISLGELYYRKDIQFFEAKDEGYYALREMESDFKDYPNSDCYQVDNGIISIVPLGKTFYDKSIYEKLKKMK